MKQFYVNINSCKECAVVEIRDNEEYVIDKVVFNKKPYFPYAKIIKMVVALKAKKITGYFKINRKKNAIQNNR